MSVSSPIAAGKANIGKPHPPPTMSCDMPGCTNTLTGPESYSPSRDMSELAHNNGWAKRAQGGHVCSTCLNAALAKVSKSPVMSSMPRGPHTPGATSVPKPSASAK